LHPKKKCGVQVEETPYGVFYRELTQAQLQQVTDRVYRIGTVKAWCRTLAFHGLGGTSAQYYELKGLRASNITRAIGDRTLVAKRAASVQVEHVRKLRKLVSWIRSPTAPTLTPPLPQVLS
jgi:hypothetical protein